MNDRETNGSGSADIFRNGRFQIDTWIVLGADDAFPPDGPVIVPMTRYLASRDDWCHRNAPFGVLVEVGDDVRAIASDLDTIATIAVSFPKFTDGRGYSAARILREELGYEGEIRAVGEVLIDQIALMRRCGIEVFEVSHAPTRAQLAAGHTHEVGLYYQPVGSSDEKPAGARPWLRRPQKNTRIETGQA